MREARLPRAAMSLVSEAYWGRRRRAEELRAARRGANDAIKQLMRSLPRHVSKHAPERVNSAEDLRKKALWRRLRGRPLISGLRA